MSLQVLGPSGVIQEIEKQRNKMTEVKAKKKNTRCLRNRSLLVGETLMKFYRKKDTHKNTDDVKAEVDI